MRRCGRPAYQRQPVAGILHEGRREKRRRRSDGAEQKHAEEPALQQQCTADCERAFEFRRTDEPGILRANKESGSQEKFVGRPVADGKVAAVRHRQSARASV